MEGFQFIFNGTIHFGKNSRSNLSQILESEHWSSACFIIDQGIINLPIIGEMLNSLKLKKTIIVECDISEPTYDKLEQKRLSFNDGKIDVFIGIGGGSALDMAKGLSVLYSNNEPAIAYRGFDKFQKPIKPVIGIPTTAGTGSEITPNASFIDTKEKKKMGINGELIRPKYAILDPELTISCPLKPTISAGVDSLVHSSEAFVAKKSNPMAKMFAREGFKIVFENLPLLVKDLENIELRERVMYGAFLSAIALMNSGTGPAAAMSYPLGVHYGVPHGIGGGIFLPYIINHNINKGCFDYADLYSIENTLKKEKSAKDFIENMWELWKKLDIPKSLNTFGLSKSKISGFINDVMDLKPALDQNPVPFYEKEITKVLDKLIIG